MSLISFFGEDQKSTWQKFWDTVFTPIKSLFGIVTTPIFDMVIILGIFIVILFFIVKPKVGLRL